MTSPTVLRQSWLLNTYCSLLITFALLHGLIPLFTQSYSYPLIHIVFCAIVGPVMNESCDGNIGAYPLLKPVASKKLHLSVFVSYLLVRLCLLLLGWSTSWSDALLKNFSDSPPPIRTLYIGKWSFTHVWISYLFSVTQIGIFVNGCALIYVSYNMWQYLNEKDREIELQECNVSAGEV